MRNISAPTAVADVYNATPVRSMNPLRSVANAMRRTRRIVLVLAVLVVLASIFFHPAVYWPVTGWLRGEAVYRGMPTSYWRKAIWLWGSDSAALSWIDKARVGMGFSRSEAVPRPAVIGNDWDWQASRASDVDPAAIPVLRELLADENKFVRVQSAHAIKGLADNGKISDAEARALVGDELLSALGRPRHRSQ